MQRMKRWFGLGAATLLGAMLLLGASGAFAVAIPTDVYTLPTGDTPTVNLNENWIRLQPFHSNDPIVDYTAEVVGVGPISGAGTPANAWIFNITFEVTWDGSIHGQTPGNGPTSSYKLREEIEYERLLFTIVDSRFERGIPALETFDSTYDLVQSGFVRGGDFAVNGVSVMPEIVRDDPSFTGYEGFVPDHYPDNWIGFYLDAEPGVTHTITMQWALGETPVGGNMVYFPNALFLTTIPEPGTATLVGVALLILGVARGRHRTA
jgi:hypothetical protein